MIRGLKTRSKKHENETLAERKARRELANRGKSAEDKVHDILTGWAKKNRKFDFDRLLDSRAAGRIVAAQVSDFLIFSKYKSATLEVKEIKSGLRLDRRSFPQHPRMVRREYAGCKGFVVVNVMDVETWWVARVTEMILGGVSWRLDEVGMRFDSVESAMDFVLKQTVN